VKFEVAITEAELVVARGLTLFDLAERMIKHKMPNRICGWYAYKQLENQNVYLFLCSTEKVSDRELQLLSEEGYNIR